MENKDWREEFEKLTPDNSSAGYEKQKEWLKNNLHLFTGDMYDEPAYTLDKDKIESFIESILQSKQEEIEGEIEKMKKTQDEVDDNDEGERYYNKAIDDLKPIISNLLK